MAVVSVIAGKGIHVPAYAGCISRFLAPRVARPSRLPWSALQLRAPASRRVPHSVSQPTPPQGASEPAADPRRHGLSNSVAPCPLRSLTLPPRSLRGLRKPLRVLRRRGEKNEKSKPSVHVSQRFCTFVREHVDNRSARPRVSLPPVSKRLMPRRAHGNVPVENQSRKGRVHPLDSATRTPRRSSSLSTLGSIPAATIIPRTSSSVAPRSTGQSIAQST